MTEYELHEPEYSGTTAEGWDAPQAEDFDTDDLSEIDDRFLLSSSGFPPDDFTDLKLPVVGPDGNLNENALQAAHGGAHSVEAVDDLDDDTEGNVKDLLEELSREEFDADIGG
ncbi:hypothetical protein [Halorarum salinum]|uniref:DUF5709 domain-containing protein n=1 Tax=Halorarum salinum TaxID=2743089 RepID=A0A7D5QJ18_9EURY|nr:hypothetical protein [Halobaculum salinum]QLG63782.1 hypothetical protein HUG12_19465 [Halobaculum salinum]